MEKLKKCRGCGESKPLDQFYMRSERPTRRSNCIACHALRDQKVAPDKQRRYHVKKVFSLSLEEYNTLFAALNLKQNGECAVCKKAKKLFLDHNHQTQSHRGLLCHHCNLGLGNFKDNPGLLAAAKQYLADWQPPYAPT